MKKIGIFMSGMKFGGVEQFFLNYLSKMNLEKYEIFFIVYSKPEKKVKKEFEKLGCKVIVLESRKKNLLKSLRQTKKIIKDNKFDIIHSNMIKTNYIPLFYGKRYNCKIRIAHSHNILTYKNKLLKRIIQKLNKRYANIYIACSEEALISGFGKNIKKSYILKNSIDSNKFTFNEKIRKKIREDHNIKDDEILIGNIGRMEKQKNQIFLLEVLNDIINSKKINNIKIMIIGDGTEKDSLKNIIYKYHLENKVILVQPNNHIENYYSAFDIFALPSLYEGLGIVSIEAQANGLNVIASNNVPKEIKLCDKVVFLKLEINIWENIILKNDNNMTRSNNVVNTDYEINNTYEKLERIYGEILEK